MRFARQFIAILLTASLLASEGGATDFIPIKISRKLVDFSIQALSGREFSNSGISRTPDERTRRAFVLGLGASALAGIAAGLTNTISAEAQTAQEDPVAKAGGKPIKDIDQAKQVATLLRAYRSWAQDNHSLGDLPRELLSLKFVKVTNDELEVDYNDASLFSLSEGQNPHFTTANDAPVLLARNETSFIFKASPDRILLIEIKNGALVPPVKNLADQNKKASNSLWRWSHAIAGIFVMTFFVAMISVALWAPAHATELASQSFTNSGSLGHALQAGGGILLAKLLANLRVADLCIRPDATDSEELVADYENIPETSTEERLGKAMLNMHGPWTMAFIDLDDMKDFNDAVGKAVVDRGYRDRLKKLIEKMFPGIEWGFAGGDEIFLLLPIEAESAQLKLDNLRVAFKSHIPHPDIGPMTFSVGMVTGNQITAVHPDWRGLLPQQSFALARELSSQALKKAKDLLHKDAVALYKPLTVEEQTQRNVDLFFADLTQNPLARNAYDDQNMRNLQSAQGQDISVELTLGTRRQIRQFEEMSDFRDALKKGWRSGKWTGRPLVVGSVFPYYRGELLKEPMESLRSKGSRIYGSWAGFKVWNTWDPTGTAGDHVIRAERVVVSRVLGEAFHRLPAEWQGELWIVRRRPDAIFFALVPASSAAAESLEAAYAILADALQEAQETLRPGAIGLHLLKEGFDIKLQTAVRVFSPDSVDVQKPFTILGERIFSPLDILQNSLISGLEQSNTNGSLPASFVWLGPGQSLLQYQRDADQRVRDDRRLVARERLKVRLLKPDPIKSQSSIQRLRRWSLIVVLALMIVLSVFFMKARMIHPFERTPSPPAKAMQVSGKDLDKHFDVLAKEEIFLRNKGFTAIQNAIGHIEKGHWLTSREAPLMLKALKNIREADIQPVYAKVSYVAHFDESGTLYLNDEICRQLPAEELEAVIVHEVAHEVPSKSWLRERLRTLKKAAENLSQFKMDHFHLKQYFALWLEDELESYRQEIAYLASQAHDQGYPNAKEYLLALADRPGSPLREDHLVIAGHLTGDQLDEDGLRFTLLHQQMLARREMHAAFLDVAASEGIDVKNNDAIKGWVMTWWKDVRYLQPWWKRLVPFFAAAFAHASLKLRTGLLTAA